jgi:hypothetical protein
VIAEGVAQRPVDEAGHEVGEGFAFHGGDELPGHGQPVIPARQRPLGGGDLLGGEAVGVLLAGVHHDLQVGEAGGAGRRGADVRAGLLPRARGLPEHRFAAAGGGEHDLGAVLPGAGQDQVDRRAVSGAGADRRLFDDLRFVGPLAGVDGVAVESFGARPGAGGAEHHPAAEREPQQVGQPRVRVRVRGDEQVVHCAGRPRHASGMPSSSSPSLAPSRNANRSRS